MSRVARIALLSLASFAGACATNYDVAEQEVLFRLVPDEDALLVLEVERGISTPASKIETALNALERALQGGKCFPPEEGLVSIDFDRPKDEAWTEEMRADFREFAANVHVEESRVFRDGGKGLGFARLTRLTHLNRLLEVVNAWMNTILMKNESEVGPFKPDFPIFDEATRAALIQARSSGHAWLSVRAGALVLDFPMTEANAASCVAAIARREVHESFTDILTQISSLRMVDGHALIRFCEPSRPVLRFASKPKEGAIDEVLLEALRAKNVLVFGSEALERMKKPFDAPTKAVPAVK